MRIICEKIDDHWSARIEGRPQTEMCGRTHRGAIRRLAAEYPGIDLSHIRRVKEPYPGRIVFVCTEPCPECRGTGKYVGLLKVESCGRCNGTGRVDEDSSPF